MGRSRLTRDSKMAEKRPPGRVGTGPGTLGTTNGPVSQEPGEQPVVTKSTAEEPLAVNATPGSVTTPTDVHHQSPRLDGAGPFRIYNSPKHVVTTESSEDFIKDVYEELQKGYGFVPFIGAGMSAPSGPRSSLSFITICMPALRWPWELGNRVSVLGILGQINGLSFLSAADSPRVIG